MKVYQSFTSTWQRFLSGDIVSHPGEDTLFLFNCDKSHVIRSDERVPIEVFWGLSKEEKTALRNAEYHLFKEAESVPAKWLQICSHHRQTQWLAFEQWLWDCEQNYHILWHFQRGWADEIHKAVHPAHWEHYKAVVARLAELEAPQKFVARSMSGEWLGSADSREEMERVAASWSPQRVYSIHVE